MLQLLEESRGDLVAFRISGDVDKQDYNVMLPVLEERIRQHGKIRVYAEVQDVEAFSLRALYEDIKFDIAHATNFSRVAIVGDRSWIDWLTVMASPFTTANVKYFDFSQREAAWEWVHDGLNIDG
ncbi:STAS/SEC14 domain-containing protein [Pontibacter saemangeumensis]|uniref:STAS/SEC14 domain-containing protein n=1 Tax=Pontibacter saemangeumensis TaxID=1084525 RepID=A0ABP8M8I0_9BACT